MIFRRRGRGLQDLKQKRQRSVLFIRMIETQARESMTLDIGLLRGKLWSFMRHICLCLYWRTPGKAREGDRDGQRKSSVHTYDRDTGKGEQTWSLHGEHVSFMRHLWVSLSRDVERIVELSLMEC